MCQKMFQGIQREKVWNLVLLLTMICYVGANGSAILPRIHRNSHVMGNPNQMYYDYSCYDAFGKAYIGSIPHPTYCNNYIMCIERNGQPVPNLTSCPVGQVFDLRLDFCNCREPDGEEICFDLSNPDHERIRFQCAEPAFGRGAVLKF